MGALLAAFGMAPGAHAATVSHFQINNAALVEGDAGTANMTFTISYTGALNNISVDWATADGTATAGADYTASSGTATFLAAGPTSQTITVPVIGDLLDEANETFVVNLTNPTPPAVADITTAVGTGTITDNDPLPSVVINDVSLTEGNAGTTNMDFTVTLSAPSGRNLSVNYATAPPSATAPADYTTTSGTLTFTPGQVTKTISVPVAGDVLDEIDETFFVNLTVPVNVTIADNQGIGTITDDDPLPSIVINDVSLVEGNAGTTNTDFTVTLSAPSNKIVTVDYATADQTAIAPGDYTVSAGTLTFNPGVLTRTFTVPIVGDVLDEFDETFFANLSNAGNATIADNQGIGTITDDDAAPSVSINSVSVAEGDVGTTNASFDVTLSAASGKTVTVDYGTTDQTATAPADYAGVSGTLTFNPGQTTKTVNITVNGDTTDEFDETFGVDLSNLVNVAPGAATGTGTITDDDAPPSVSINSVSVAEGDVGTTNASFDATLSAVSGKTITVDYSTADGTAVAPADYGSTSGTLTFAPGQTTKIVNITVNGDTIDEFDETFGVGLSNLVNVTAGTLVGTGTILDDDPPPSISINDVSLAEGDIGTSNMTFIVTLSAPSGKIVTVDYGTADQTAAAPTDYVSAFGTLTFNPGQTSKAVDVLVTGDVLDEFDETFFANLSNPGNATIADPQGLGTITDDDAAPVVSIDNQSLTEGDVGTTTATFTVSLSAPSGKPITVDYATADQTATAPADYTGVSGSLSFAPGQTSKTVDVAVSGDTMFEVDETFTVQLSNSIGAGIGVGTGNGTILNDDSTPGLVVTDVSLSEGNVGDTIASFTVALGAPSAFPVTVDVITQDGTATQPSDYDPIATTVTFAPGETTKTVDIAIHGDTAVEPNETFTVQLLNAVGASIADGIGDGTIVNDDAIVTPPPPPHPTQPIVSIGDASTAEGGAGTTTTLTFPVSLSGPLAGAVTVAYRTANGSATERSDYDQVVGSVQIPAGKTTGSVEVNVIGDDRVEPDETLGLEITGTTGAQMGSNGTGTIVNDDRSTTRLTLHVRVHGGRRRAATYGIGVRGRLINGAPRLLLHILLMRERGGRWVVVGRETVHTRSKPHLIGSGSTAFGYRATFRVNRGRAIPSPHDLPRRRPSQGGPGTPALPYLKPRDPCRTRHLYERRMLDARTPVRYGRGSARPHRTEEPVLAAPIQTTFDQGISLDQVTFCVVDLETTGGSPTDSRITEVGAVKFVGGERIGSFQALVDPEIPIPPFITHLTGIDDRAVASEPSIEEILPAFLEFCRGAVFVAHNARFDFSFLNANLARLDYDPLPPPPVCTARLARRVVWPDVPNVKLQTLARYFRTRVQPNHRALADAEACAEVLHGLLDLGGRLGILTLGDLHEAVRARGRPHFGKIRLADHLPHAPGVYLFRGRDGRILYVGKSKDLRARVKSYFYGDERKKIDDLLAETLSVDGVTCDSELEALVVEARLIRAHEPKYNQRGKTWRRYAYVKVDPAEAFPRLKVVRVAIPGDGCTYLGPFGNASRARLAKEALEEFLPIRRCTKAMSAGTRFAPCALADIGRCVAPCDGRVDPGRYGELVRRLVSSLTSPGGLLRALERRMADLADQERYEEAGLVRDRLRALADALARSRMDTWLVGAGALTLRDGAGSIIRLTGGALVRDDVAEPLQTPCSRETADELAAIRGWLRVNHPRVQDCGRALSEPVDGGAAIARIQAQARATDDDRPGGRARP